MVIFILLFVLSYEIAIFPAGTSGKKNIRDLTVKERIFIADVVEPVVQKASSTKVILRITGYLENGAWYKVNVKVLAFIRKDEKSQKLFYGDRIILSCLLSEPEPAVIPGGFDYRHMLRIKGIIFKTYVRDEHWRQVRAQVKNPLYRQALVWRCRLLDILMQHGLEGREFGVASALLLGYVDEVDGDLMKDYAATGVLHILSVSGMHVGMIFLVLEKMLSFLARWRTGRIVSTLLSILLIWFYALITGLSPAVLRAAAMLSLVIVGNSLKRSPDTLNILAASFFFLLIWDPKLLMDMGFQLSYLAVVGIVLLYQSIYKHFVFTNWVLDKVWSLIAVSIAAQLATTPMSLYYFHQFPNYFLLANIFVVPFSNLIIYTGILALILSGVPLLSMLLAKLLALSIGFLNGIIHFLAALPGSVTHGIFIEVYEMVIIYAIVIMVIYFISLKQKRWIFLCLVCLVFLQGNFLIKRVTHFNTRQFFIYDTRNSGLYDCISKGSSILIGDTRNLENPFFADNLKKCWGAIGTTGKYRLLFHPGISNERPFRDPLVFFKKGSFFQFHDKRFAIICKKVPRGAIQKLKVDYLIISGNPRIRLADILCLYSVKSVIIDNSNSPWRSADWMKEAAAMHLSCHSVPGAGPFVAEF